MKQLPLFILLSLWIGSSTLCRSQVFGHPGATWVFESNLPFTSCWDLYEKCTYTADTIIGGENAKIVHFDKKYHLPFDGTNTQQQFDHYFKVFGDTVSILDDQQHWVELYNFSLQTGDSTHSPLRNNLAFGGSCDDSLTAVYQLPAIVSNHGDTIIGLDTMRFYTVYYQSFGNGDPSDTIFETATYYERFITLDNWYPKDPYLCNLNLECAYPSLYCYRDNDFILNASCTDLSWFDLLETEELSNFNNLKLFPNPASDLLIIDGTSGISERFTIISMDGKIILANVLSPIPIIHLRPGIYVISNESGTWNERFIKL